MSRRSIIILFLSLSFGVTLHAFAASRPSVGSGAGVTGLYPAATEIYAGVPDRQAVLEGVLRSPEFDGTSVSILAVTAGGDTLLRFDPTRQCLPASNMKLVTTALALHSLGADYRYRTSIGYSGEVADGTLHGDLYIIGGGDPTLGSHNGIAEPIDKVFARWLGFVRDAGIGRIDGHVIGDGRLFPGMREQESWQLNDSGTYYGTGVCGLNFYENELDFRVAPGAAEGEPLDIRPTYPEVPWMTVDYDCSTGRAGSGNSLYFYTSDFVPYGRMRGTFALARKPKTEGAANKFPEYTAADCFTRFLADNGIHCSLGPADLGPVFGPGRNDVASGENYLDAVLYGSASAEAPSGRDFAAPPADSLTVIGSTESPALKAIVEATNRDSNNMYAETLMRTLGLEVAGEGTYLGAYRAEAKLLSGLGVWRGNGDGTVTPVGGTSGSSGGNVSGTGASVRGGSAVIRDGSGLSRENHVSAAFLCSFLRAMMQSPAYGTFVGSLPYPGSAGTLAAVLKSAPESVRPRIRMKSGSMGGVRCFSGYILNAENKEDTIIFSILVNNYSVPTYKVQKKIEEIILLLIN